MPRRQVDTFIPDAEFLASVVSATIANNGSLSPAINIAGKTLIRINMPASWTAANLTFQVSPDDSADSYRNLHKEDGTEYAVQAAASRSIVLDPASFFGISYIKVRSGTSGTPVNQAAERTVGLVVRKI